MHFLIAVKGCFLQHRVPNEIIRRDLTVFRIHYKMKEKKRKWYAHLETTSWNRLPRAAMNYKPQRYWDVGRQEEEEEENTNRCLLHTTRQALLFSYCLLLSNFLISHPNQPCHTATVPPVFHFHYYFQLSIHILLHRPPFSSICNTDALNINRLVMHLMLELECNFLTNISRQNKTGE